MKIITPVLGFAVQLTLLAAYAFSSKDGPNHAALFAAMWISASSLIWMIIRDGKPSQQVISAMWAAQVAAVLIVLSLSGISLAASGSRIKEAIDHALPRWALLAAAVYFALINIKLSSMSTGEMRDSAAMRRIVVFFNEKRVRQEDADSSAEHFNEVDKRRSDESNDFVCDKLSLNNFHHD